MFTALHKGVSTGIQASRDQGRAGYLQRRDGSLDTWLREDFAESAEQRKQPARLSRVEERGWRKSRCGKSREDLTVVCYGERDVPRLAEMSRDEPGEPRRAKTSRYAPRRIPGLHNKGSKMATQEVPREGAEGERGQGALLR